MLSSPIWDARVASDALEAEHDGGAPRVHSTVVEEYHAATCAVALVDRSAMGRLHLTGADALDLLNRLSTNKLNDLQPGQGLYTVVTTNKGRIVDLLFLLRLEDRLLALTSPQAARVISDWIDFYTFVEDVSVEDYSNESAMLGLVGPGAGGLLDIVSDSQASELPSYGAAKAAIGGVDVLIVRTDFLGGPGYDLVLPAEDKERMREGLLGRGLRLRPEADGLGGAGSSSDREGCPGLRERAHPGIQSAGSEPQRIRQLQQGVLHRPGGRCSAEHLRQGAEAPGRAHVGARVRPSSQGGPGGRGRACGHSHLGNRIPSFAGRIGLGYVRKRHATPGSSLRWSRRSVRWS